MLLIKSVCTHYPLLRRTTASLSCLSSYHVYNFDCNHNIIENELNSSAVKMITDDFPPSPGCDNRLGGSETAAVREGEARRQAGGGEEGKASGGEAGSK